MALGERLRAGRSPRSPSSEWSPARWALRLSSSTWRRVSIVWFAMALRSRDRFSPSLASTGSDRPFVRAGARSETEPEMPKVVIYTTSSCPYCIAAKRLLTQKGVTFEEIGVDGDSAGRSKMAERAGGRRTVPQIFIGETSRRRLRRSLRAGRSGPPRRAAFPRTTGFFRLIGPALSRRKTQS